MMEPAGVPRSTKHSTHKMGSPLLLGVAALQLETQAVPTASNLAHTEALLDAECHRLGVRRYDDSPSSGGVHLDLLVLPEIFNAPYLFTEAAWYAAEGLQDAARSPSLRALSAWAARYRCFVAATLLEATPEGHIYNTLVLATPSGGFLTRPSTDGRSDGGGSGAALVRKHRAASLEGFVFRSGGRQGHGGEPAAHVVDVDIAPLLQKRDSDGGSGPAKLRLAFSICYENLCFDFMQAILEAHQQEPIDLLVSPFCAMAAHPDHPTFKWPAVAAERQAAQIVSTAMYHAAKLQVHVAAAHHSGPWKSPLPRLLPFLPRDPIPLSGPMLGCSAIYAPGGAPIVQLKADEEGLVLAHLPLLQGPHAAAPTTTGAAAKLVGSPLEGVVGTAAAAAADAGPAMPYAYYPGGYVLEPVGWQVRWGFLLMEALGWLLYHLWRAPLRARVARTIAAQGMWIGPLPEPDCGRGGWAQAALAVGALVAAAAAVAWARRA